MYRSKKRSSIAMVMLMVVSLFGMSSQMSLLAR